MGFVAMQVLDDTRVQPRHYKYAIDIAASAMNQADPGRLSAHLPSARLSQTCWRLLHCNIQLSACPSLLHSVISSVYALVE